METNPFEAPMTASAPAPHRYPVEYRIFRKKSFTFSLSFSNIRNQVRDDAKQAIENEIGADNVISIAEHDDIFGSYSVTVWYRQPRNETNH